MTTSLNTLLIRSELLHSSLDRPAEPVDSWERHEARGLHLPRRRRRAA